MYKMLHYVVNLALALPPFKVFFGSQREKCNFVLYNNGCVEMDFKGTRLRNKGHNMGLNQML